MSEDVTQTPAEGQPAEEPGHAGPYAWTQGAETETGQPVPPVAEAPPVYPAPREPDPSRQQRPADSAGHRVMMASSCLALVIALAVAGVTGFAAGLLGGDLASRRGTTVSGTRPAQVTVVSGTTPEVVAAAAAAALPSVVNIDVTEKASSGGSSGLPSGHPTVPGGNAPSTGTGSGVAFRSVDGGTYILTNNHVVENASVITVTDGTGEQAVGTLIGRDADTDVAVVRIGHKVPLIKLGDSTKLIVGQLVVAIGSPFGLQQTVTSGVVSALHRSLPDSIGTPGQGIYPLVDVIQTDAAINPGNSGGALVDRMGRLVGINTAIIAENGVNGGIGFAIPAATALRVADQLTAKGKVTHPFLGVNGRSLVASEVASLHVPSVEGAYVVGVTTGTAAATAGLRKADVIVSLNGKKIRSMDDLILAVRRTNVGDRITLGFYRDGVKKTISIIVGDKPAHL
jgi:putative serine protease PepD